VADPGDEWERTTWWDRGFEAARTRGRRARFAFHVGASFVRRLRGPADLDEAERWFRRALDDGEGHADFLQGVRIQLASVSRERGDLAAAHAHLDEAGDDGAAMVLRAVLLRDEQRHEEAVALCRRAVERYERAGRSPYHPHRCEGLSWWALGRVLEARTAFAAGLERAVRGSRVTAEGAMHAVSIAPALAVDDASTALAHLERAEKTLLGAGEGDRDVLRMLEEAERLALAQAPTLAPRVALLVMDQRRVLFPT
jgi:tetratricopeptide (TPR) repeat protein